MQTPSSASEREAISGLEHTVAPPAANPSLQATLPAGFADTMASTAGRVETAPRAADYAGLGAIDPTHYVAGRDLARGGMGRIRIARDRRLGRDVAIKELLVNAGDLAQRFEREARVTARLQHPSIVAVYEAGAWPSGEPFFAMKLVAGRSFDVAIDAAGTLDARLALLPNVLAIADAMSYAHSLGVIHRDLKPKNVLVGDFGETVVVDWGLAKDLQDDDSLAAGSVVRTGTGVETEAGEVMGTPAYMAPEQARGERVDARADVYALGALLFHTLAGKPPVAGRTTAEVLANLLDGTTPSIVEAQPGVPPDLVTIVNKALARAPADRYPTARELAEDLRRFQTGQLVGAHRYSAGQLVRRWLRKHRAAVSVAAVALVVTAAIGVLAVSRIVRAQHRAEEQRVLAVANKTEVEGMLDFLVGDLRQKLEPVGRVDLLGDVARKASAYLDRQGAGTTAEDLRRRMLARRNLGSVLLAQGDTRAALGQYRESLGLANALVFREPSEEHRLSLAESYGRIGGAQTGLGAKAGALGSYRAALAVLASANPSAAVDAALGKHHLAIGDMMTTNGDLAAAVAEFTSALEKFDNVGQTSPADRDVAYSTALADSALGRLYLQRRDLANAATYLRAGTALADKMLQGDVADMRLYDLGAKLHRSLGRMYMWSTNLEAAEPEVTRELELTTAVATKDPTNIVRQLALVDAKSDMCSHYSFRQAYDKALEMCRGAVELAQSATARDPSNVNPAAKLVDAYLNLADILNETHVSAGAIDVYRKALAEGQRLVAMSSDAANMKRLSKAQQSLGVLLVSTGKAAEAKPLLESALAGLEKLHATEPSMALALLPVLHVQLGDALLDGHDAQGAVRHYDAACELLAPGAADRTQNSVAPQLQYALALEKRAEGRLQTGDRAGSSADVRAVLRITDEMRRFVTAGDPLHLRSKIADIARLARKIEDRGSKPRARKRAR